MTPSRAALLAFTLFRTLLIVAAVLLIVFALIKRLGGNMSL